MKKRNYQTIGRQRLLDYLGGHPDQQFTVDELCLAINGDEKAGKSSIYRQLDELLEADSVRKFHNTEKSSVYQYVGQRCDCKKHFHAKCLSCGKMEHLGCSDSVDFAGHLLKEHGFAIDCSQSILWGLCSECLAKGEK